MIIRFWKKAWKKLEWWERNRLADLQGQAFCDALRAVEKRYRFRDVPIGYDAETGKYVSSDHYNHVFANKARYSYFLMGKAQRGLMLGDEYCIDKIDFRDRDTIVDVGANIGDFELFFYAIKSSTKVIAFEPSPVEFECLQANLAANPFVTDFKAHNIALWRETTEGLPFFVKSESADSSLIEIEGYERKIVVPCQRLDDVLERRPYRLLKLEAEGAEPEILEGAREVIGLFDYVAADVGFERGIKHESTFAEVVNFLVAHGFEAQRIHQHRHTILFRNKQRAS